MFCLRIEATLSRSFLLHLDQNPVEDVDKCKGNAHKGDPSHSILQMCSIYINIKTNIHFYVLATEENSERSQKVGSVANYLMNASTLWDSVSRMATKAPSALPWESLQHFSTEYRHFSFTFSRSSGDMSIYKCGGTGFSRMKCIVWNSIRMEPRANGYHKYISPLNKLCRGDCFDIYNAFIEE